MNCPQCEEKMEAAWWADNKILVCFRCDTLVSLNDPNVKAEWERRYGDKPSYMIGGDKKWQKLSQE